MQSPMAAERTSDGVGGAGRSRAEPHATGGFPRSGSAWRGVFESRFASPPGTGAVVEHFQSTANMVINND